MLAKAAINTWQSKRSTIPPWPGIKSPKSCTNKLAYKNEHKSLEAQTFILKARLNPDAKKPPKGARIEANTASGIECSTAGIIDTVASSPNCDNEIHKYIQ